jgi:hypothetical protein
MDNVQNCDSYKIPSSQIYRSQLSICLSEIILYSLSLKFPKFYLILRDSEQLTQNSNFLTL